MSIYRFAGLGSVLSRNFATLWVSGCPHGFLQALSCRQEVYPVHPYGKQAFVWEISWQQNANAWYRHGKKTHLTSFARIIVGFAGSCVWSSFPLSRSTGDTISQCFPSQKWSTVVTQITRAGKITNFANVNDRLDMVEQRQRLVVWSNTRTGTFCVCGCRFTVHTIRWVNSGGGGGEKERKWYFFGQGEGVTMPQRLPEFTVNDFFTIPLIGTMSPLLPKQPDKKSFCSKKSTTKLLTMTRKLVSTPQRLQKLSERLSNYWRGGAFRGSTPTSH